MTYFKSRPFHSLGCFLLGATLVLSAGCGDSTDQNTGSNGVGTDAGDTATINFQDTAAKADVQKVTDTDKTSDTAKTADTGGTDTTTVDGGPIDAGLVDAGDKDTGPGDVTTPGADTDDGGGAAADTTDGGGDTTSTDGGKTGGSCQGVCNKYVKGSTCQCDKSCLKYKDCCSDFVQLCTKPACAKDADCDDKLSCTDDKCVAGACKNNAVADTCVIDKACYKTGETDTNTCLICKPDDSREDWTVDLAASCDDGNGCTTGDTCKSSGACSGQKTAGCCAKDADCSDGNACSTGACDATKGTCSFSAKPGCCGAGVCCDLSANAAMAKATPCSTASAAVEYKCDGKQVQKREAFPGCDGVKADVCSAEKANWSWTQWQTVQTCTADQTCKTQGSSAPICEGGVDTGCKAAADCDDSNPCTKDSCAAGKCSQQAIPGCCTFASDCDDGNACTVDLCANNTCSSAATPCVATSDCEVAACDSKTGACKISVKAGWCKVGDQCSKDGASNPTNSCQTCTAATSQTDWSVSAACSCSSGACCDIGAGTIKTKAAKCDDTVKTSEFRCTKDGKSIELRQAYRGCTGKSNTCSISKTNYSWTPWFVKKTCGAGTVCEVASDSTPGICKSLVVKTCTPGTQCCTAAGKWAAKASKCGTAKLATEYKCSSSLPGSDVQTRMAYGGCTGSSKTCSTAKANRSWSAWSKTKDCKSPSKCQVTDATKPGICTATTVCKPGSLCCTDTGSWAAAKSKCGSTAIQKSYSCSTTKLGGAVMVTESFGGCAGGSATCSYADKNLFTGKAKSYKVCGKTQVCNISDPKKPGLCSDPINALCTKKDAYESGTSISKSFYLGLFKDSAPAKILNPKVHFKSESDRDYFSYRINILGTKSVKPTVHIEWSAPQKVRVCAYYRCENGPGGRDCLPVKCPTGFKSGTSGTASGTIGNGCCSINASATGTLAWQPALPTLLKKSLAGRVYFDVQNAAPVCQEAAIKLVFGLNSASQQCKPGTQCCTKDGKFAAQKTKCGATAALTQYKCTGSGPGSDVQSRQAWRGCTGKSTTCSVSSSNYTWTAWKTVKNCKTSETCALTSLTQPGICKPINDPICAKTDKYESGKYYSSAYNLGSFSDSSVAKILNPKVHFKSATDNDYFVYSIADKTNLTDPRVQIEWTGGSAVSVCAYYRCNKGTGGKDCKPITCPKGSTPSTRSYVSATKGNGCCKTATKGVLSFKPNAAGSLDESGKVYLRMFNAAPICQEVTTKLVFGSKTKTQCTPGSSCCSAAGTYALKKTQCSTSALETHYKCSSSLKGASVLTQQGFAGCTGTSTTCSTALSNRYYSPWKTKAKCSSAQVCSVTSLHTAGTCKAAVNPVCSKADKYESGTSTAKAYDLGTYKDSNAAKVLSPKVIFSSKYDYDYLKYRITDGFNFTDPRVQISFSGADKVRLCAYYRCEKGPGGKDCSPIKCPAGSTASSFSSVSSAIPNGCCMTAKSGTLSFKPNAPGTTNETGTVYLRFSNAGNICQEVSATLVFGSKTSTQCNPNTTCCTASGSYAAKKTKCGSSALKTEYKCSSTANSGNVLVRKAYAGCAGGSKTCSTSTSNRYWTAWSTFKNCTSAQVCSVTDPSIAGVCKTTGSSAPLCKVKDKYESGYSPSTAYNIGAFKDNSKAKVLDPDVHFKTPFDSDYIRYSISDSSFLSDPVVQIEWTAAEPLQMCAWYRCNKGPSSKNCAPIKCPAGAVSSTNYYVSSVTGNGCCKTGKTGVLKFTPDAPGTTNESGWVYLRAVNKAKICQYVNTKVSFGGSTSACGDGKCTFGESNSCKQDCGGSCLGKCSAKFDSKKTCQCDAGCEKKGDCCWDHNLYCAQ